MAASRFLNALIITTLLSAPAWSATRLRVQTVTLAGVAYHQGSEVWALLKEGDALTLVRESDNTHDPLAVRVDWQGRVLGYLPRDQSAPIATALDRGTAFTARISKLRDHPSPRERILIEVFAELGAE